MNSYSKNRISITLWAMIMLLILNTGCDKELNEIDESKVLRKLSFQEEELINSTNNLSLKIIKAEFNNDENANYFFSPVSVNLALGMVYNGVGEKEKLQILQTTGLESLAENEINKSYNDLLSFLQASNSHSNISYANSLWFSQDIHINEDFRTKVMAYYDAEVEEINFNKTSSAELINHWGNMKTQGRFEKIINHTIPKNENIFLVNAFGLNTAWKPNRPAFFTEGSFYGTSGLEQKTQLLNLDGMDIRMNESEDFTFYEFPFEDKTFLLSLVVPQSLNDLKDQIQSFTMEDLKMLGDNSLITNANISLPDIKFSNDKPLKSTLSLIGLEDLFSANADLSPSFRESVSQIGEINQQTMLTLTGFPTSMKAQGLTFSEAGATHFIVDKPFLYFVRDKLTNTVLFAGYFANVPD